MMITIILIRQPSSSSGTFGTLTIGLGGFKCVTLEPPWDDNDQDKSCIPAGTYLCTWRHSPTKGYCYHVDGVPGRTDILIHAGNLVTDTKGCILLGLEIGILNSRKAILRSNEALRYLEVDLQHLPFRIQVIDSK